MSSACAWRSAVNWQPGGAWHKKLNAHLPLNCPLAAAPSPTSRPAASRHHVSLGSFVMLSVVVANGTTAPLAYPPASLARTARGLAERDRAPAAETVRRPNWL